MTTNNVSFAKFIGVFFLGVCGLGVASSVFPKPPPPAPSCKSDFTKCADIRDMANNYGGWSHGEFECKWEADKLAKYGTPEWSWMTFTKFYNGNDPATGTATLIDDDVKFQNGFGAMVHSRVECQYDFRAKKVINVNISAK